MSSHRETLNQLRDMGFVLHRTGKHHIFKHPVGGLLVCAVSPSDNRASRNILATARRLLRQKAPTP